MPFGTTQACACLYECALIMSEFVYVCTCGVVKFNVNFKWVSVHMYLQLLIGTGFVVIFATENSDSAN